MNLNSVFAYGSTVDVLIKCTIPTVIRGVRYEAGQPYTLLHDVAVSFNSTYNAQTVVVDTPKNVGIMAAHQNQYLSSINIQNVGLTQKVYDLFFKPSTAHKLCSYIEHIRFPEMVFNHTPIRVWVYRAGELLTEGYNVSKTSLIIDNFREEDDYSAYYEYEEENLSSLSQERLPYFALEVRGCGNKNGITNNFVILCDKVELMPNTQFNFDAGQTNRFNLYFTLIDSNNTVSIKFE